MKQNTQKKDKDGMRMEPKTPEQKEHFALNEVARMNDQIMRTSTKFRVAVGSTGLSKKLSKEVASDLKEAKEIIRNHGELLGDYWSIEKLKTEVYELEIEYQYLKRQSSK